MSSVACQYNSIISQSSAGEDTNSYYSKSGMLSASLLWKWDLSQWFPMWGDNLIFKGGAIRE